MFQDCIFLEKGKQFWNIFYKYAPDDIGTRLQVSATAERIIRSCYVVIYVILYRRRNEWYYEDFILYLE